MVRECVALSILTLAPACSLLLDFDEKPPADAGIDSPFTLAECEFKEPNDSAADAKTLDAGETGPAAICSSGGVDDKDYYKFTAASATVTVGIMFTNRPAGDLDIRLWDATGTTMLAQSRGFGNGELITCPGASPSCAALTAGTDYVLEVFPAVAGSANSYTVQIMP